MAKGSNNSLLFSDVHVSGKKLGLLFDLAKNDSSIKLLIFAGDLVNMGEPVWFADRFIGFLKDLKKEFVWVPGNNDFGRAYHKLNANFKSLEGKLIENEGRLFTGVGGSPASWAGQYEGESMIDKKKIGGSILISHFPPPGILTLQQKDLPFPTQSNHPGLDPKSRGISDTVVPNGRRFSDAPLVHICGHLHYRWGTAFLGQTKVIQLASLETGHYAIMDLDTLAVDFRRFK